MHQKRPSQRRTEWGLTRTQTMALASGTVNISAVHASQPVVFCYYSSSCQTVRWGKLIYHWLKSDWIACLIFGKYTLKGTCCITPELILSLICISTDWTSPDPDPCYSVKGKTGMLRSFLMLNYFIFIYCVGVHRGQRTISGSQFSLCTIWVLEIDLSRKCLDLVRPISHF